MKANDDPVLLTEERMRSGGITTGTETNLVYSGHQPVPYIYRISSFLKVAFSLTPGSLADLFQSRLKVSLVISLDSVNSFRRVINSSSKILQVIA